jgi:lipopolysaccharide transport system permease protein
MAAVWVEPFERAWQYRELIRAVVRRELKSRFRDSLLGWVWAVFAPLLLLAGYTVVFTIAAPAAAGGVSTYEYAASIFCGLVIFNVFSELIARAPTLLHEHSNFVKKSIFPSETIAWTSSIRAFVYGGISFVVLLVFLVAIGHGLEPTLLLAPIVLVPFFLLMLGTVWILMALGAFTKDVSHAIVSIAPVLMFVTPVFFRLQQLPPGFRPFLRLNLVGNYIEMLRDLALSGKFPDPILFIATVGASYAVFLIGYRFFHRYKAVIVDVI